MRHAQQRPFGLCGDQRQQKPAFVSAQTLLELAHHTLARRQERIELDGLSGHACEIAVELLADVAQRWKQDLVDRPVMAREIDDKGSANVGGDSLMREELHDVE